MTIFVISLTTLHMRIQHDDGDVKDSSIGKMNDWGWLTRDEMVDKVLGNDDAVTFYNYMLQRGITD